MKMKTKRLPQKALKEWSLKVVRSIFRAWLVSAFCTTLLSPHPLIGEETKTLVFVSPRYPDDPLVTQLSDVYSSILKRLGYGFEYLNLPARRASMAADSGEVDGELTRVYSYNDTYINLVRIEEPNHQIEFAAYTIDPDVSFSGWESLKGYSVDCRRGVKLCTEQVAKVTKMNETNTIPQLVRRLLNGYTDVIVRNAEPFDNYMQSAAFAQIDTERKIRKGGVMQTITAHAFIHKKYEELAPRMSELLKEMKTTGEYQFIRGWPKDRME